jgi:hypothetical protein
MMVTLDGSTKGNAALLRIAHQAQGRPSAPQIALIYASAYVRLKQNADPLPAIPFGGSFVLGPAYWSNATTYHHNPRLDRIVIDTSWLPDGPLRMHAAGTNHDFTVAYQLDLPPPTDRQTRMHITQTYTATADLLIDAGRRAEHQGFKLAQVSSMFVDMGGSCAGGQNDCHDSNAARFIADDMARREVAFDTLARPGFVFANPAPLGDTWLDTLHTDDAGWQGNTPNLRIALDELPADRTITVQGYIAASSNPNDDNVGMWLHDDGSASWRAGQGGRLGYWLLAQDNPPDPPADLGLRPGMTLLDFESSTNCFPVVSPTASATVEPVAGAASMAAQLAYDLGDAQDSWAQIRCNFDPPLDLSAFDHLRLEWRGTPSAANSIQIGLVNPAGAAERIFARGYHHVGQHSWWGRLIIPFTFLEPWNAGTNIDLAHISALFISVVKDADDAGGPGTIAIDNLGAFNVAARAVPAALEPPPGSRRASVAAAGWLAAQQRPNGLLKSWDGDTQCLAYTYDQALALVVFARERMWANADALADALAARQNPDGSWYQTRDCDTLEPVGAPPNKWEGDIAWASQALSLYLELRGPRPAIGAARDRAAGWLAGRIDPADGCLVIDHTEAILDSWWALQAAGRRAEAAQLKSCLLTFYWDEQIGRFKGGRDWWQPYLDNQTWGAAFLQAVGEQAKARRALSYAHTALITPARGGQLFGFDGQAGPWSVWNEGAGQYIAAGGPGAADLLRELLAQQRADGAMPSSPDDWNGGGTWATRWHGVAPTAWLYNAMNCGPQSIGSPRRCFAVYLPSTMRAGNSAI